MIEVRVKCSVLHCYPLSFLEFPPFLTSPLSKQQSPTTPSQPIWEIVPLPPPPPPFPTFMKKEDELHSSTILGSHLINNLSQIK